MAVHGLSFGNKNKTEKIKFFGQPEINFTAWCTFDATVIILV